MFEDGRFAGFARFHPPATDGEAEFVVAGFANVITPASNPTLRWDQPYRHRATIVDASNGRWPATVGRVSFDGEVHLAYIRDDKPNLLFVLSDLANGSTAVMAFAIEPDESDC